MRKAWVVFFLLPAAAWLHLHALETAIGPRVLFRSAFSLDGNLSDQVVRYRKIAPLHEGFIYLADLVDKADPLQVARDLQQREEILYALPDIMFHRERSEKYGTVASLPLVSGLWSATKGKGVAVAVLGDGFDFSHPEFSSLSLAFTYDADQRTSDASKKSERDRHGTMVAGLIFAAHDGEGVDGVAPEAKLIAIRQVSTWTSDMILAFAVAKLAGADVVN